MKVLVLLELQTLKRFKAKLRYHVDVEVFLKGLDFGEKVSKGSRDQHATIQGWLLRPQSPIGLGLPRSASFFISLLDRNHIYICLCKSPVTILILFLNNTSAELTGDFGFH